MSALSLRVLARALGGEVASGQVVAPGPGHSKHDRSMTVRFSSRAPDGFMVHSHAGDDWRACRDHVRERLGLPREMAERPPRPRSLGAAATAKREAVPSSSDKGAAALKLWRESADPCLLVEKYLASRGLDLEDGLAGSVLRWNDDVEALAKLFGSLMPQGAIGAMVALFRDIATDAPRAVGCTFLDRAAVKLGRLFKGPVGGCAVKLDADESIEHALHIGEGLETVLAARQLGLKPAWALGSKGAIGAFAVLAGVDCLTILAEPDAEREIEQCAARWHAAGREVVINEPIEGKDLNEALVKRRARP